ncbi:MAG: hypothetical protein ABEK59_12505 [Halobacteria archaeon]
MWIEVPESLFHLAAARNLDEKKNIINREEEFHPEGCRTYRIEIEDEDFRGEESYPGKDESSQNIDLRDVEETAFELICMKRAKYQANLSDLLNVDNEAVSNITEKLEDKDLIKRTEDRYKGNRIYRLEPLELRNDDEEDHSLVKDQTSAFPTDTNISELDDKGSSEVNVYVFQF